VAVNNFYASWRLQSGAVTQLSEDTASPPEKLLQAIWRHQRLVRDNLASVDGRPVRVLHPGFQSVEGGPDFRDAIIQFGEDTPITGDIEVDVRPQGWSAHGHNTNKAFEKVILQVVWEASRTASSGPPILPLRELLDAPLGELSKWLACESGREWPEFLRGDCCAPLRELKSEQLNSLLNDAAQVRLQGKAGLIQARARQAGWEQALWEGLFRALGYKHNVWPMQRLGELRPLWSEKKSDPITIQARLLGLSGLLPFELGGSKADLDDYVRQLWDCWWRDRDSLARNILPASAWRFHGLRPANHPQRRLALAAQWETQGNLPERLTKWCLVATKPSELPESLLKTMELKPDPFWSWHCTFRSARLKKSQPMLGSTRVTDLAINVVLPWLWVRAVEGGNTEVQKKIEERYQQWPAAQDNSLLKLARERLLGGLPSRALRTAALQQGLIQIVRDFCEHSNSLCEQCQFPNLVRQWQEASA
jgi:hypothetical protein